MVVKELIEMLQLVPNQDAFITLATSKMDTSCALVAVPAHYGQTDGGIEVVVISCPFSLADVQKKPSMLALGRVVKLCWETQPDGDVERK